MTRSESPSALAAGQALRAAWSAGAATFGGWAVLGDAYAVELAGRAKLDWIGIDVQHGLFGEERVPELVRAAAVSDTPAIVRLASHAPASVMRALDAGAAGVIVPLVERAEQAAAIVAACRYPPDGIRSWGPTRAALGTPGYDPADANAAVICATMVESAAGLEAVKEIARVPGLDAVFVGPRDLALSLGAAAGLDAAILAVRDACRAAGVVAGIFAGGAEAGLRWAQEGFQLVALRSDAAMLASATAELAAAAGRGGTHGASYY